MTGQVKYLKPDTADQADVPSTSMVPANAVSPMAASSMTVSSSTASNTIDQVRELLYGDALRHQGRSVESLADAMKELEQRVLHRFDEVQASIEALARSVRLDQSADMRKVGKAIMEMGREIASLGELHDRVPDSK